MKKVLLVCLVFVFCIAVVVTSTVVISQSKTYTYTIVIDAGHGGIDGGCEGYSGTKESLINLEYAQTLKEYCENFGMKVVMTRINQNGLYSPFAGNKKKDDMLARKNIIQNTKPDFVVSIHMNSFDAQSSRGAQVFYNRDNQNSQLLAEHIQKQFVNNLTKARKTCQQGDYYILNSTIYPSVIVECGFISNKEE
ncbi:MAG: N-acetylmuramoyl-L-alanine amidase [Clostridia bacterium]|nr:N-acetylmuramoyl-L-alanine amidase [Clostridia bacterium]